MHVSDLRWLLGYLRTRNSAVSSESVVLDFGCADGSFVRPFLEAGVRVLGIEVNVEQAVAAERAGIDILDDLSLAPPCDIIIMRGVLHYLEEPVETLRNLANTLREGGALFLLANPNAESVMFRRTLNLPALQAQDGFEGNMLIPGSAQLRYLLETLGLRDGEVSYPYWSTPYAHPFQDLPRGLLGLAMGVTSPRPFPRNMFNLAARRVD